MKQKPIYRHIVYQNRNFLYQKLLLFSVLTFIKWRLNTELLANIQNVVFSILKSWPSLLEAK
jgi:hypothetical protein